MRLSHGAASHVGLVRSSNEDSFVVGEGLYAVCDGMGGTCGGEIASETACQALVGLIPGQVGPDHLQQAMAAANEAIWEKSGRDLSLAGMGTTLTLAIAAEGGLLVAHVGDSRAYVLHDGTLTQVTTDHSLVAEMVRRGQLTPDEAAVHRHRTVITRALGTDEEVQADVFRVALEPGDRVLLCTDGLSGMVPHEDMARLLANGDDPQAIAETLVAEALSRGGEDNVTAVVVIVLPDADSPASEKQATGRVFGPSRREADEESRGHRGVGHWSRWLKLKRRGLLLILLAIVILSLAGGLLAGLSANVYFLGTLDGRVALYRGLPYSVLGVRLYRAEEVGALTYADLQPHLRARIDTRELTTREEAEEFLRSLEVNP